MLQCSWSFSFQERDWVREGKTSFSLPDTDVHKLVFLVPLRKGEPSEPLSLEHRGER